MPQRPKDQRLGNLLGYLLLQETERPGLKAKRPMLNILKEAKRSGN